MSGTGPTLGRVIRALFHVGALTLIVGLACNLHRIPRSVTPPMHEPSWGDGWSDAPSSAAIVVDRAVSIVDDDASAPAFSDRDWSLGWINTLAQEIGPVNVVDLGAGPLDLAPYQLVVVSTSCRDRLDAPAVAALRSWVADGGALIVDAPDADTAPLAGIEAVDELPRAAAHRGFTTASTFLQPRAGMDRLPLYTRLPRRRSVDPGVDVLAELAGAPAIASRDVGAGVVVSTLFDFATFVTATQQGRPNEGYDVSSRYPEILRPRIESNDLMASIEYHDNPVPLADIVERALVAHVRERTLIPAFWYWPDGAAGVYAMTHDDEEYGAKAEWMPADETRRGVPSTCYYIPTARMDRASLARVASGGHALGVHWYRTYRKLAGIPRIGPFIVPITLSEQVDRLNAALPDGVGPVRHCRLHILEWDTHYTRPFREMAATTIDFDSSYGPDYGCRGYMFGTGYPFRPLDVSGVPFDLHELPYNHSEMEAGADAAYLTSLAEKSRDGDHTAIVSLFHPPFWGFVPSVETYRLWRELPDRMRDAGLVPVTMETIRRFTQERESAEIRLTSRSVARVTVRVDVPDSPLGHHLVLPETVRGQWVRATGRPGTSRRTQDGRRVTLVPLPPGQHEIELSVGP